MAVPRPDQHGVTVLRYFYEGPEMQAPGTFWTLWGGYITAYHVYAAQANKAPPFAQDLRVLSGAGIVDACLMGCDDIPSMRPRNMTHDERIYIFGFPKGSAHMTTRIARATIKRGAGFEGFIVPTWNCRIDERPLLLPYDSPQAVHYEPVTIGMSGGLVMGEDGTPLGLLVGSGAPIDWDADGDSDQSCEIIALCDIWDVFAEANDAGPMGVA